MTPERLNSEVRIDNEYVSNNRVTSVAMQRRCEYAFRTIERLRFLCGPCKVFIKKSSEAVEAGLNTSTVTLRVVGGDEKGSLKTETIK
jgi:hypothetical protein